MFCSDVKVTGRYLKVWRLVRATRVVSKFGGLNRSEYLQSRNEVRAEVAVRGVVKSRLFRPRRKAEVVEEEMRKRTPQSTGIGGQTSRERFIEITLGRAYCQQGLAATCKDSLLNLVSEAKKDNEFGA